MDCLIKELGIDNLLGNPIHTPTIFTKEEIVCNHRSVLYSFGISTKDEELDLPSQFQPRMKNWIYRHSTGFLNYIGILTNSVILLGLPNAPRNIFPNYLSSTMYSFRGQDGLQSYCDTS
jgi:hypothetical protein